MEDEARNILRAVYSEVRESHELEYGNEQEAFSFHMSECLDDMEGVVSLLKTSSEPAGVVARRIVGFLYHVVPHLNAAARLLLNGVPDSFVGVGVRNTPETE